LEEMIQRKTLLSKATQLGLAREPDVVRQRENILIGELRRDKLEPVLQGVKVSDVDVEEYYEQHRPKFTIASKRRLAMIYIKTHRKMPPEKLSECRERARQARAAALSQPHSKTMGDFGKMAIKRSEDQTTRYKGGDIGWITEGRERYRWPDEVVAAAFALNNVGDVSEVVATPTGLYIVKFSDHREAVVTPIEKVATQIRHTLILQKRRQAEKTFLVRIRDSFEIEIYSDVLKSVPTIAPNASPSRDAEPPALR
ncbi:MAG: peptidylprolyl isomerase, partial [Lentisphaeria bacterium]|nr:peptidylprolyl isomerase [Lentisphaeria bacterium]